MTRADGVRASVLVLSCLSLVLGCSRQQTTGSDADLRFTRTYGCGSFGEIVARYDNSGTDRSTVRLTIDGASRDLVQVVAASGARYATEHGLTPDHSLIWWTSGPEATLLEMPLDHTATLADARALATCRVGP